MLKIRTTLLVLFALGCAAPMLAVADASIGEVYEAANAGHLDQAKQMMSEVLQDHPHSARAHYVAAEVYARAGDLPRAREELATAQNLAPGLSFARPESVRDLQEELAQLQSMQKRASHSRERAQFPIRTVLLVLGVICILWLIMRRRTPSGGLNMQYPGGVPAAGGPGVAPGLGSGIAGGLASGLAVGAGVVAGEELAHHFLDGRQTGVAPQTGGDAPVGPDNSDMGGNDFGVSDTSSWDDGSGSIGGDVGGGDDWS